MGYPPLPHVYAVGDVIGYPSLASAAYDQGRIAAQALVKGEATAHLIEDIPHRDLYHSGNQFCRQNRAAVNGNESALRSG
ncbi:hypothetical protein SEEE1831_23736, partial [Salmonella enterica subsp. enterica serovar Enteritidis str. 13183-1]